MAVTVTELIEGRTAMVNSDFTRDYTRVYRVHASSRIYQKEARDAPGIPAILDTYVTSTEIDVGALVSDKDAEVISDDGLHWDVTVNYTSKWDRDPFESVADPLARPAKISLGSRKITKVVHHDLNHKRIQNSAQEPFDPLPTIDDTAAVLRIQKNVATFDYTYIRDYTNAVNSASWFGFDAGDLRIEEITAEREWENGLFYFSVTITILVLPQVEVRVDTATAKTKHSGHKLILLDAGYNTLTGGTYTPIVRDGHTVNSPWPLDGAGDALAAGFDPTDGVRWRVYQVYPEKDFADLGLVL